MSENRIGTNGVLHPEKKARRAKPSDVLVITDHPTGVTVKAAQIVQEGRRKGRPTKSELEAKSAQEAAQRAARTLRTYLGYVVGGIGVAIIVLSIIHCKDAIEVLTGSHWSLALLLAIGIDAGLVACKVCSVVIKEDEELHTWADRYVYLAIAISILLNVVAFVLHGNQGLVLPFAVKLVSQIVLGFVIPTLAFIISRVVGKLV